jgi:hypothetical protein
MKNYDGQRFIQVGRHRADALAGAVAEGVDLGPRGEQIREIGQTLETMSGALRLKLAELGADTRIDGHKVELDQLTRMARVARAYGLGAGS